VTGQSLGSMSIDIWIS